MQICPSSTYAMRRSEPWCNVSYHYRKSNALLHKDWVYMEKKEKKKKYLLLVLRLSQSLWQTAAVSTIMPEWTVMFHIIFELKRIL